MAASLSPEKRSPCTVTAPSGGAGRSVHTASTGLLSIATTSAPALAQANYPSRPIRLVVPFPAGGGTDVKVHRDRADALFDVVEAELRRDHRLGGAVTRAELTTFVYRPRRNPKGVGAAIEFVVEVTTL